MSWAAQYVLDIEVNVQTLDQPIEVIMKELFPGYYRSTKQELTHLWDTCIFVFDASVLLNLYRYTPETSTELLAILKAVSDRLWVPYQVALEYHRNRHIVIAQQHEAYDEFRELLQKTLNQLKAKFDAYQRHPYIDTHRLLQRIQNTFSKISAELDTRSKEHPDLIENDNLRETITSVLSGKVGSSYSANRLGEIFKEGEERYKRNVPPGYMDAANKEGNNKYGDLIVWLQILDMAQETKKPVVLVTDDSKEDWWWKYKGRTLSPRPELVEEIVSKAGVSFHMYRSDQFMEYARDYLKRKVDPQAIDEVRNIRKQDEEMRKKQAILRQDLMQSEKAYRHLQNEIHYVEHRLLNLQREVGAQSVNSSESTISDSEKTQDELMKLQEIQEKLMTKRMMMQAQLNQLMSENAELSHHQGEIRYKVHRLESETGE